jgi:hypothetical protein
MDAAEMHDASGVHIWLVLMKTFYALTAHHESCAKSFVECLRYFVFAYHCLGRAPQPLS